MSVFEDKNLRKKRQKFLLLSFILIVLVFSTIFCFKLFNRVLMNEALLIPKVDKIDKVLLSDLSQSEINESIDSFKNPLLIPKGLDVPEFSAEQNRPSRIFLDVCVSKADAVMQEKEISSNRFFTDETVIRWNGAYAKTKDTKYLAFAINKLLDQNELANADLIAVADILRAQRLAVPCLNSDLYLKSIVKIKKAIVAELHSKSPMKIIDCILLVNSLPLLQFKVDVLNAAQPVLVKALQNLNEDNKVGQFLTPEESTLFSLHLIKLAWYYYLEKKQMPDWLYSIAEKEACRLAYRLEQDGCLPVWNKAEERISRNEEIYKAAIVFNRDDLRYIACNGLRVPNAYPPSQKEFVFNELGLLIMKTGWNHAYLSNRLQTLYSEELQITYDKKLKMLSVSMGAITQLLFKTNREFDTIEELKASFQFNHYMDGKKCDCKDEICDYKLEVKGLDLELICVSKTYLNLGNDMIKSYDLFQPVNSFMKGKNTFDITLARDEKNNLKEINFLTRRNK